MCSAAIQAVLIPGAIVTSATDYDRYLPELLTLANRIATDLDHIHAIPATEITCEEPEHIDYIEYSQPPQRNVLLWRRHEDILTDEWHTRIAQTATWLRSDLPRLAASVVATDGVDIEDSEEDRLREFAPGWVEAILLQHFLLDAGGQTSYWRPEDKGRATYGALVYRATAASDLLSAWRAFVNRSSDDLSRLRACLETAAARLERPGTDLVADLTQIPDAAQEEALHALKEALRARGDAESELAAADRTITERVRACIGTHIPVVEIAQQLGVTRARVYQIRDGRR